MAKGKKQVVAQVPIDPKVQKMMNYLAGFFTPGQLQLRLQEHLDGLPLDMAPSKRELRIEAMKLLGYKDLNRKKSED